MASMRNGSGDEYFILFSSQGAILKGFAHESCMSPWAGNSEQVWPGVLDQVPEEFEEFLINPAFSMAETTFCIWRRMGDPSWQTGQIEYPAEDDPDGSDDLLFILDGDPNTYKEFAERYYERSIELGTITDIYDRLPLTPHMLKRLNPEIALDSLAADLEEIDYPRSAI